MVQLDGLRFYAVFMVMIAHWLQWQWGGQFLKALPFVHGVTLFFVLSGYLITRILLVNKDQYLELGKNRLHLVKQFFIRRFLRIFPVYYLTILLLFLLDFEQTRELFLWLATYTINIYQSVRDTDIGSLNHFWSLSVEEQFYVFWPFLMLFTRRKHTLFIICTVIGLSLLGRYLTFHYLDNWRTTSYFTLNCMHALGIGALLAYLERYQREKVEKLSKLKWLYLAITVYLIILVLSIKLDERLYLEVFDEFSFALVAVLLINRAAQGAFKGIAGYFLENRFVNTAGKISYGMYIFHLLIPAIAASLFDEVLSFNEQYALFKYLLFGLYFIATFCISYLSYKLFEAPINKLKRRYPYFS